MAITLHLTDADQVYAAEIFRRWIEGTEETMTAQLAPARRIFSALTTVTVDPAGDVPAPTDTPTEPSAGV